MRSFFVCVSFPFSLDLSLRGGEEKGTGGERKVASWALSGEKNPFFLVRQHCFFPGVLSSDLIFSVFCVLVVGID